MTEPYPMVFEPILKQKVWGGRRLARYGKRLEGDAAYGESWELADLASTSASGGGGGAAVSVVANGPLTGRTIGDAIALWGEALLGEGGLRRAIETGERTGAGRPVFPLLLKYLDAAEHLSVQVHPSPAYAAAHPGAHLKTESWYVVEAEPGAMPGGETVEPGVFVGLGEGVDASSFAAHVRDGSVASDLAFERAVPGRCYTLPSGTVHALGGGVLVAEVQTPSDTTFRVYDWVREYGRPERELHVEQALACIDFDDPGSPEGVDASQGGRAAETDYYTIDSVRGGTGFRAGHAAAVMVLAGSGRVVCPCTAPLAVAAGTTVLIPASVAGRTTLEAGGSSGGDADALRSLVIGLD